MKLPVYAMRDTRTGFLSPAIDENDATACRNFEHALMNHNTIFGTHNSDFDLYRIGMFDKESGKLEPLDVPEFIMAGSTVYKED